MKIGTFLAIATTIAAAALFAACGGGDSAATNSPGSGNQTSQFKVQHGLAVAALAADFRQTSNSSSGSDLAALPETGGSGPANGAAASSSGKTLGDTSSINGAPQAASDGTTGITVQGYGLASADADSAAVQFYFSRYNNIYPPVPLPYDSSGSTPGIDVKPTIASPGAVKPITEADLQPVITALTNAGVAAADIQFVGQNYYDSYNASATLQVTIKTIANVDSDVQAAQTAASGLGDITLQSTNVSYTLQDCAGLEKAAMDAAVTDSGERGALLAGALHVGLGSVTGASDYSYSPSGVPCTSNYYGYPMSYGVSYDSIKSGGSTSNTVQVVAQISVTYAMK